MPHRNMWCCRRGQKRFFDADGTYHPVGRMDKIFCTGHGVTRHCRSQESTSIPRFAKTDRKTEYHIMFALTNLILTDRLYPAA